MRSPRRNKAAEKQNIVAKTKQCRILPFQGEEDQEELETPKKRSYRKSRSEVTERPTLERESRNGARQTVH